MAYVVAVKWVAQEGEEDRISRILSVVAALTRAEPGCRMYVAHRSVHEPRTFFLYEQYEDEAAFQAHRATDHFKEFVLGEAVPRLEARDLAAYTTMD